MFWPLADVAQILPRVCMCCTVKCHRAGEHVGGSPIQMVVSASVASAQHSQVAALTSTMTAGMPAPVLSVKLRDRFGNARTTSGDGRQMCIRVRPVDIDDLHSCTICKAHAIDELNTAQNSSHCQRGRCGLVCPSDEHGFEFVYNGSVASRVTLQAFLFSSVFASCGSGSCVPITTCSNMWQMLSTQDPCSALSIDHEIGRPSVLTIVPGRTGPLLPFSYHVCPLYVRTLRICCAVLSGYRCVKMPGQWQWFGGRTSWFHCFI